VAGPCHLNRRRVANSLRNCGSMGEVVIRQSGQGYMVGISVMEKGMRVGGLVECRICTAVGLSRSRKLKTVEIRCHCIYIELKKNIQYKSNESCCHVACEIQGAVAR